MNSSEGEQWGCCNSPRWHAFHSYKQSHNIPKKPGVKVRLPHGKRTFLAQTFSNWNWFHKRDTGDERIEVTRMVDLISNMFRLNGSFVNLTSKNRDGLWMMRLKPRALVWPILFPYRSSVDPKNAVRSKESWGVNTTLYGCICPCSCIYIYTYYHIHSTQTSTWYRYIFLIYIYV